MIILNDFVSCTCELEFSRMYRHYRSVTIIIIYTLYSIIYSCNQNKYTSIYHNMVTIIPTYLNTVLHVNPCFSQGSDQICIVKVTNVLTILFNNLLMHYLNKIVANYFNWLPVLTSTYFSTDTGIIFEDINTLHSRLSRCCEYCCHMYVL